MMFFQRKPLRRTPLATPRKRRSFGLFMERLEDRALLAAPTALADVYLLDQDSYLSEPAPGVLANDLDDDGDPLEAVPGHPTVIRTVLVPSTMVLLGRWNWYLPSRLGWLPELHVEGGPAGEAEHRVVELPTQAVRAESGTTPTPH